MKTIITALFILFASPAQANVSLKVDLETKYQNKIYSIIKPIDPYAQVSVNVNLQSIDTVLPGLHQDFANVPSSASQSEISFDDIKNVQIEIRTRAKPFPSQTLQLIENSIGIPANKRTINVKDFDADSLHLVEESEKSTSMNQVSKIMEDGNHFWADSFNKLLFGLGGLAALFFIFGFFKDRSAKSFNRELLARAEEGISKLNSASSERNSYAQEKAQAESELKSNENFQSPSAFEEDASVTSLPTQAVIALFSDCYWCGDDTYGSFLWRAFSQTQRETVLKNWKYGRAYANFVQTVSSERKENHTHPYYLSPASFQMTSLEDSEKFVKQNPAAWSQLSPIRQERAKLSLKERLNFWKVPTGTQTEFTPPVTIQTRSLQESFQAGSLESQDELEIFRHPEMIPGALRKDIHSLVWVALLPLEARTQVTASFTARELAQVWTAPEEILNALKAALPEKKYKLVSEIRSKLTPNRKSQVMVRLTAQALEHHSEKSAAEVKNAA